MTDRSAGKTHTRDPRGTNGWPIKKFDKPLTRRFLRRDRVNVIEQETRAHDGEDHCYRCWRDFRPPEQQQDWKGIDDPCELHR